MTQKEGFDPHVPFIHSENLLEYACPADWLLDKPVKNSRNDSILRQRRSGRSAESVRCWVEGYDEAIRRSREKFEGRERYFCDDLYATQAADHAVAVQTGKKILENERERHAYACGYASSALRASGL